MNAPLGGRLIARIATAKKRQSLLRQNAAVLEVAEERVLEAWNIATGAYSPLTGFMGEKDMRSVLRSLKTARGVFWPIPIILDISADEREVIMHDRGVFLADPMGRKFAYLRIEEVYTFPKHEFEKSVFGTHDTSHPGVAKVRAAKEFLVGGAITWIGEPLKSIKPTLTPKEARAEFRKKKWKTIVAFHTRNVPHLGHEHIQREALKETDGLLVQPLVGKKKTGDFRNEVVVAAYRHFVKEILPRGRAILSFLPYSAYFAGPREALLTAVIRRNFGCTHFIVGRDHTGVGQFYSVEQYARMIKKYEKAMGIKIFHFGAAFYCTKCKGTAFEETCPHDEKFRIHPSGTLIRKMLTGGKLPRREMLRPEIARVVLRQKELFV